MSTIHFLITLSLFQLNSKLSILLMLCCFVLMIHFSFSLMIEIWPEDQKCCSRTIPLDSYLMMICLQLKLTYHHMIFLSEKISWHTLITFFHCSLYISLSKMICLLMKPAQHLPNLISIKKAAWWVQEEIKRLSNLLSFLMRIEVFSFYVVCCSDSSWMQTWSCIIWSLIYFDYHLFFSLMHHIISLNLCSQLIKLLSFELLDHNFHETVVD